MAEQEEIAKIPLVEKRLAIFKSEVQSRRLRSRVSVVAFGRLASAEISPNKVTIRRANEAGEASGRTHVGLGETARFAAQAIGALARQASRRQPHAPAH